MILFNFNRDEDHDEHLNAQLQARKLSQSNQSIDNIDRDDVCKSE
jgi:hypothetical protein